MEKPRNWFSRAKIAAEETLPNNERAFGIMIVVFCILMIIFFMSHQINSTGFFTSKFGVFEMLLFYGFWIFWISTASLEAILTKRLLSRILDTFGGIIFATISIAVLLVIFPYDFSHLADALPEFLRILMSWISNDVARVIMVILMIAHLAAAIYSPFAYKFVDKKHFMRKKSTN